MSRRSNGRAHVDPEVLDVGWGFVPFLLKAMDCHSLRMRSFDSSPWSVAKSGGHEDGVLV